MRSEQEMMGIILNTALQDSRIRAVYMNGSRTNKNVPRDIFQDYDIVYVVTETKPFYENLHWIERFGKILYMQEPERLDKGRGLSCKWEDSYGWLIQFEDGNRLDLHVSSIEFAKEDILTDKLCRIFLDKDKVLPEMPEPTDEDYYVQKPSEGDYIADCNNFWWCQNNVAKGLWRNEIPYVMDMLNEVIRPILVRVISWEIGQEYNYKVSIGKSGKYMYRYLPQEKWNLFLKTYSNAEIANIWDAVFCMCDLFDSIASEVGKSLSYAYDETMAVKSRSYLEHIKTLPKDAKKIYE